MDSRKINEEYTMIAEALVKVEPSLQDIKESNVRILFLSSTHKKVSGGGRVLGQCEKIPEKYKWAVPCDFTITIFEPNVRDYQLTEDQIRALIHHELLHVGIDREEKLIIRQYGVDWSHSN